MSLSCCCGSSGLDPGALVVSMFVFLVVLASVSALVFAVYVASVCLCLGGSPSRFLLTWLLARIKLSSSSPPRRRLRHPLLRSVVKPAVQRRCKVKARARSPAYSPTRRVPPPIYSTKVAPSSLSPTSFDPEPVPRPSPPLCPLPVPPAASPAGSDNVKSPQSPFVSVSPPPSPSLPSRVFGSVIPYPGEPGARCFDKSDISEFLRWWNIRADDFGLSGPQKCDRVLDYCALDIREVVCDLDGFESGDWLRLEKALRKTFRFWDSARRVRSKICDLVEKTSLLPPDSFLDLRLFILQYSALTRSSSGLTPFHRVVGLLRGLPESEVVVETRRFCAKNGWMWDPDCDDGSVDVDFKKIRDFVLGEIDMRLSYSCVFTRSAFLRAQRSRSLCRHLRRYRLLRPYR
jgi:hypothetical protein